ncbi:MAG TPA: hypothetical protein VD866_17900 [Urbifossiella sp.]|nr:hypothetical protein [Urbifossiella sp.]
MIRLFDRIDKAVRLVLRVAVAISVAGVTTWLAWAIRDDWIGLAAGLGCGLALAALIVFVDIGRLLYDDARHHRDGRSTWK